MRELAGKTCWLIGASEGLGRALAYRLHSEGARLLLSARNESRLRDLCSALPGAEALAMDVTDPAEVERVSVQASKAHIMVYNAGAYEPMTAGAWDTEAILQMTAVNYTGAVHVIGAVLPRFLTRDGGEIVLVGSLAGYRGLPAAIGYGPGKAALRSMAETMRHDLRSTNVTVKLINPGFIRTRLTAKNTFHMPMLMSPEVAAGHVVRAIKRRRFRTDFPVPFSWLIRILAVLPDPIVYLGR